MQSATPRKVGSRLSRRTSRVIAILLLLAVGALGLTMFRPVWLHLKAVQVLIAFDAATANEAIGKTRTSVVERDLKVGSSMSARLYTKKGDQPRTGIVLVHGMHPLGMHEPRLVALARAFAHAGIAVLTPHIEGLAHFELSTESIGSIDRAASRLASHLRVPDVGVFGISFSGALALIAASRVSSRTHIGFVVALGAHHDLLRFAAFALGNPVTGPSKEQCATRPHPYAAAVIAFNVAEDLFSPADLPRAKEALLALLQSDRARSTRVAATLSQNGRAMFASLQRHRSEPTRMKAVHEAVLRQAQRLRELSPVGSLHKVSMPVVLMHGKDDPVVPWTETMWLAHELPGHHVASLIVTPLIRHAELRESASWADRVKLVHTVAVILSLFAH
jgi:pimeloyl-ACP methyl ester carboxylesterase